MAIAPTYTAKFDIDEDSSTKGKFILTDTSDYAGEGIALTDAIGYWVITNPDGTQIAGSFASPHIDADVSLVNNTLSIALDANLDYMTGTYSFQYFIRISGVVQPGDYSSAKSTFSFCKTAPKEADITITHDCFCKKLTSVDNTAYGTYTTLTRSHEIFPPPTLGLPSSSTNSKTFVYSSMDYTGVYTVQIDSELTYVTGIFTVLDRVKTQKTHDVICDLDFCGLTKCLNNFLDSIDAKSKQLGGWDYLDSSNLSMFFKIMGKKLQYDNSLRCGLYDEATTYYNDMKALLGCDCGCPDDDTPTLIDPYCGGTISSGTITVVAAGAGISVSATTVGTTTTYTVTNTITGTTVALTISTATFNSLISYDAAISVTDNSVGTAYAFDINLADPEAWREVVDTDSPPSPLPTGYVAGSILELGVTSILSVATSTSISHWTGSKLRLRRDIRGYTEMRGGVTFNNAIIVSPTPIGAGTSVAMAITRLPAQFRPADTRIFAYEDKDISGIISVSALGDIIFSGQLKQVQSVYYLVFDNVHFVAEQ